MSLSRITCMCIRSQGDNVRVAAAKENGKWAGWCNLHKPDGDFDHFIFNTKPIFETEADAIAEVEKILAHVRELPGLGGVADEWEKAARS